MGMLTPPKWSKSVPMCLRNVQKNLVHGALIDAEILTSPSPMYLLNLAHFSGADALSMGVLTPSKWSKSVPMCLRNVQKNLVHGALIDAEILTSPSPMYLLNLACFFGGNAPPMCVLIPPKWSKSVPMCPRNLQNMLVFGALVDAEILTSPLPYVFAQLGPFFRG